VIQTIGLLPHRTVEQNIGTVPWLLGWDRSRIEGRVRDLAAKLRLDDELLGRYPAELSGGQRQRVGVARALAADPPVMLMDEPFAAVDPVVRGALQDQFLELQRSLRKTIVFVTHDIDEAIKMADRIAILNIGARLEQYDTPAEILRAPASPFVEEFVGEERGLKRLGLIPVSTIDLDPVGTIDGMPSVASHDSLRFALDAIVTAGVDAAAVVDDGRPVGVLTLERLGREIEDRP
jgi:osmoprotectant transport system ATP-binding protein